MKHSVRHRKFCCSSSHRSSMFINMVISLVEHERIKTTLPKAKELRPYMEKVITLAKKCVVKSSLHSRRLLISRVRNCSTVKKLTDGIANRCLHRNGGYVRIIKCGFRKGDCSPMAIIELVDKKSDNLLVAASNKQ